MKIQTDATIRLRETVLGIPIATVFARAVIYDSMRACVKFPDGLYVLLLSHQFKEISSNDPV